MTVAQRQLGRLESLSKPHKLHDHEKNNDTALNDKARIQTCPPSNPAPRIRLRN